MCSHLHAHPPYVFRFISLTTTAPLPVWVVENTSCDVCVINKMVTAQQEWGCSTGMGLLNRNWVAQQELSDRNLNDTSFYPSPSLPPSLPTSSFLANILMTSLSSPLSTYLSLQGEVATVYLWQCPWP